MNFIHYYPQITSAVFYTLFQGSLFAILRLTGRKRMNFGFFLCSTAVISPVLLRFSGYYIIREQTALCFFLMAWSLIKTVQSFKYGLSGTPEDKKTAWISKMIGIHCIAMLPFTLFLTSRPVFSSYPHTLTGLILVMFSFIIELLYGFRVRSTGWEPVYRVFHMGTLPFLWGLFIMVSPQFLGTDWLTLAGPLLYTLLVSRPWAAMLTGNIQGRRKPAEASFSTDAFEDSGLIYPEDYPFEESLPNDPQEHSDDHTLLPVPSPQRSGRALY